MDVCSYLNSKDIAEHCRSVNHQFNAREAAFIVNNAFHLTIKERHEAYNEIIAMMPDMPDRETHSRHASLHQALRDYMRVEKELLEIFYNDTDKAAYSYGYYAECAGECGGGIALCENDLLFDSFAKLMEAIKVENEDGRFYKCALAKRWFNSAKSIELMATPEGEPLRCGEAHVLGEEDEKLHYDLFHDMWARIPTPFKRGDIVTGSTPHYIGSTEFGNKPFVLDSICYWGEGFRGGEYEGCDFSDMTACGYWVDEGGLLYDECMHAYQDIEYYRGELAGDLRILTAISNHIKGEIHYPLLLNAYEAVRGEKRLDETRNMLGRFFDSSIRLAGVEPHRKCKKDDEDE